MPRKPKLQWHQKLEGGLYAEPTLDGWLADLEHYIRCRTHKPLEAWPHERERLSNRRLAVFFSGSIAGVWGRLVRKLPKDDVEKMSHAVDAANERLPDEHQISLGGPAWGVQHGRPPRESVGHSWPMPKSR